jgi:hypothetical protein
MYNKCTDVCNRQTCSHGYKTNTREADRSSRGIILLVEPPLSGFVGGIVGAMVDSGVMLGVGESEEVGAGAVGFPVGGAVLAVGGTAGIGVVGGKVAGTIGAALGASVGALVVGGGVILPFGVKSNKRTCPVQLAKS